MGAIGGLVGLGGGAAGTSFAGPQTAGLTAPVTSQQLGTAYTGNQGALTSQQQLLNALQAQQGIQNQSQVYGQLQGIASGTGPNPALAQLNQTTGQNVANQAALAAGQRGASGNVGLISRQAAQQGSAAQQQAVGQAATLAAQQQLGAIGQAGQIAGQQVSNQIGATSTNTQAQQAEQAALLSAQQGYNSALNTQQSNINTVNAGLANTQLQGQQSLLGSGLNAIGPGLAMLGGPAAAGAAPAGVGAAGADGAASGAIGGLALAGAAGGATESLPAIAPPPASSFGQYLAMMAGGGKVPALVSPGEKFLRPADVEKVKKGANPMKVGETIPGKPKVGGAKNSYANDTVPKKLDRGGIVIPRSVTQSDNPTRNAIRFVQATLAKKRSKA